jgi:hypothetical protein
MHKFFPVLILVPLSMLFLSGCTAVWQTVYIQDAQIEGQINQPPLNITDGQKSGSITISPKIYINSYKNLNAYVQDHTKVDNNGNYNVDTVYNYDGSLRYSESRSNTVNYSGYNFRWNLPDITAGLQIDAAVTNHFAVSGGFNFSAQDQRRFLDGSLGIGFFSEHNSTALRIDLGILWHSYYYDVSSVVVTTEESSFSNHSNTDVIFYRDNGHSTATNIYGRLTFNSVYENSPVNFFVSLSLFGQTLLDYRPNNYDLVYMPFYKSNYNQDLEKTVSITFLSFTPGISVNINKWSKLNLGVNLLQEAELDKASRTLFVQPTIQFDMRF